MAEENTQDKAPELTPEQRDVASAEKYRAQLGDTGNLHATNADKTDEGGNDKPQRPDHIPEKFWDAEKGEVNVEALAKSYSELERAKSKVPGSKADGEAEEGDKSGEVDEATKASLAEFSSLREQATANLEKGEPLTDEMYAGFEKRGLSRQDVDAFITGQEAIGTLQSMKVHAEAGGETEYKAAIEWARGSYTAEEVAAFDRDIHSLDEAVWKNAVRGLKARYAQANGESGTDVTDKGSRGATSGYASRAEMVADMRDLKYAKDPAFREEVARKVAAARAAGVDLRM